MSMQDLGVSLDHVRDGVRSLFLPKETQLAFDGFERDTVHACN